MFKEPLKLRGATEILGDGPVGSVVETVVLSGSEKSDEQKQHLSEGTVIGRYAIVSILGKGGMGVVYKAYDPSLSRHIAVKLLRHKREEFQTRLIREAQALAQLSHPNVVAVYDVGTYKGSVFVAMEIAEGVPMDEWLQGKHSHSDIMKVLIQAGCGLAAAHHSGVLHRDFKPSNIVVSDSGEAKVVDFGLARSIGEAKTEDVEEALLAQPARGLDSDELAVGEGASLLSSALTQYGAVMGTPGYIAPEQLIGKTEEGESSGTKADQFAFAATVFLALNGKPRFKAKKLDEYTQLFAQKDVPVTPWQYPARRKVRQVVERGLALEPQDRFNSVDDMVAALRAKSRRPLVLVGGLVAAIAVGLFALGGQWDPDPVCELESQPFAGYWNAQRRATIEQSFVKAVPGRGPEAFALMSNSMDNLVEDWQGIKQQACEATYVHGNQTEILYQLRSTCLDRKREQVGNLLNLLETANVSLVNRSSQISSLVSFSECDNVSALLGEHARLPDDVRLLGQIERAEANLVKVHTLQFAGRYEEAAELAVKTVGQAGTLGYEPTLARAHIRASQMLANLRRNTDSRKHLELGLPLAARNGLDRQLAIASLLQLQALVNEQRDNMALEMLPVLEANLVRYKAPPLVMAAGLFYHGKLLSRKGDYKSGEEKLRASQTLLRQERVESESTVLTTLAAEVYVAQKQYDLARTTNLQALEVVRQYWGEYQPKLDANKTLVFVESWTGNFDLAWKYLQDIRDSDVPNKQLHLPGIEGVIWEQQGQCKKAIPLYRLSVTRQSEYFGHSHGGLAEAMIRLGGCMVKVGDVEALQHLRRAKELQDATFAPAYSRAELAFALAQAQRLAKHSLDESVANARVAETLWRGLGAPYAQEAATAASWIAANQQH